jgi:hypothetical protein
MNSKDDVAIVWLRGKERKPGTKAHGCLRRFASFPANSSIAQLRLAQAGIEMACKRFIKN